MSLNPCILPLKQEIIITLVDQVMGRPGTTQSWTLGQAVGAKSNGTLSSMQWKVHTKFYLLNNSQIVEWKCGRRRSKKKTLQAYVAPRSRDGTSANNSYR